MLQSPLGLTTARRSPSPRRLRCHERSLVDGYSFLWTCHFSLDACWELSIWARRLVRENQVVVGFWEIGNITPRESQVAIHTAIYVVYGDWRFLTP